MQRCQPVHAFAEVDRPGREQNPYPGRDYEIQMSCPEFTSLCPLGGVESDAAELALLRGGAPDFATITGSTTRFFRS